MTPRAARIIPVLLAAAAGAIVAVNMKGAPSPRPEPAAQTASQPPSLTVTEVPERAVPTSATAPVVPAVASAPAEPARDAPPRPTFDLAPPSTREELLATEIRCDRKVPEDCERAAFALDAGIVVPRDARRAAVLRRIALTRYVKQCESDRAQACARLAEMHEVGELVRKNPANAKALRKRVGELCTQNPTQPGCS
ncbi:MAG TPA: hypothetical protein VIM73_04390 [Polyangiaceae bacterium]